MIHQLKILALHFQFRDKESYNKALSKYRLDSPGLTGLQYIITERPASNTLLLEYSDVALREIRDYAVGQNLTTLRNRVNELGVSEPIVQRQGSIELLFSFLEFKTQLLQRKLLVKQQT